MAQRRLLYTLVLAFFFVCITTGLMGCSSSTSPSGGGGASGAVDPLLVGVWWSATEGDGLQVLADGTAYQLTAVGGKVALDTAYNRASTQKITSASGGHGTIVFTGKSPTTGRDTTITNQFSYVLTNSNAALSVTQVENGTSVTTGYVRTSIGADVITTPVGGTNTVSITVNGTAYTFTTAGSSVTGDTLDIYATMTGAQCEILLLNHVSTQTIGTSLTSVFFVQGSTYFQSTAGTVTVTSITGNNTQGTFSVTLTSTTGTTVSASGSFNVTHS